MAITNAQQYKQILQKEREEKAFGGLMGIDGRKAYVGGSYATDGTGKERGSYQGRDDKGGYSKDPGQYSRGGDGPDRSAVEKGSQYYAANNPPPKVPKEKKKLNLNIPDFKTAAKKGINFFRKGYYNRFPNNPEMEFRYIDQMSEDEYDDLPQSLKDAFEKTKTSPAIKSGKTYKDFDKLSFEDFDVLANDPKFKQYAYDRGSPGLFVSGDMSKVGDKFVKKDPITGETLRDPKTGQILYGYSPVRDGGGGDGAMSDYERRLLELERAMATATATPEVEEDQIINYRLMADGGRAGFAEGGMPYEGGIMDLESGRQQYFLGKLVKKVTRGVKKIAKSPIGKAALIGGLGFLANSASGGAFSNFFKNAILGKQTFGLGPPGYSERTGGFLNFIKNNPFKTIGGISALSGLMTKKEEDDDEELYAGADIDDPRFIMANASRYTNRRLAAEGGSMDEPVAKKTMPLLDMDGQEMDLRAEGGFVPLGRMEKADDVPARLSKNEFVFTADAVRNAGEGDVDKGAEVMYNMMKNLESGGEVSEESQGLEGAREMFQTSQRLEEVI